MEEAKKETPKLAVISKPKQLRFRCEDILPSAIVDVFRLYEQSLRLAPEPYPDQTMDDPKTIQSAIYSALTSRTFMGVIVKQGKRPVGQILADVVARPIGAPHVYLRVSVFWVDPQFRKQGVGSLLFKEMSRKAKASGVHFFESLSQPDRDEMFIKITKGNAKVVSHVLAGKITQE